jgi:hypothetical protein
MKLNVISTMFIMLLSFPIACMEMQQDAHSASDGKLTFRYIENFEHHCKILEDWLIKKIGSNPKAAELLQSSLQNGDLKVEMLPKRLNYGGYVPSSRRIELLVDFTKISPEFLDKGVEFIDLLEASITQESSIYARSSVFFLNHILRTMIFELGNSINKSVTSVLPHQFFSGERYARAMEIAEFETQNITIPVFKHGTNYCNWYKDAFVTSDLQVLKDLAYNNTDSHYQLYVSQYNKLWICNKICYVLHRIPLCSTSEPAEEFI